MNGICVVMFFFLWFLLWVVNLIFVDVSEDGVRFDFYKFWKFVFDCFGSNSYFYGYKIFEVGLGKFGLLGEVFLGEFLCFFLEWYF